jgi:HEPN domain-containing protein
VIGAVAFHILQYVEKSIKSKLLDIGIEYPRTHDIGRLLKLLPDNGLSVKYKWHATALTSLGMSSRYDDTRPRAMDVNDALAFAKDIVAEVSKIRRGP